MALQVCGNASKTHFSIHLDGLRARKTIFPPPHGEGWP
ncbi:hypothetical protein SXCC_01325 [Gluconacetobacter sp. SXCC-1]|nr:hypothetical protein SXCC_01325 [Gluconacetobacter sp. SXCC-1]